LRKRKEKKTRGRNEKNNRDDHSQASLPSKEDRAMPNA